MKKYNIVQKLVTRQLVFYLKAEEIHLDPTSQHSAKQIPAGLTMNKTRNPTTKKEKEK